MARQDAAEQQRIAALVSGYPTANLDLVEGELIRQRTSMTTKLANTYTRATILIGAAGVLGGVSATGATDLRLWVLLGSLALYAIAAACGLVAMRPRKGAEVDVESLLGGTSSYDQQTARKAVVASNIWAHLAYERSLKARNRWVVGGFIALTLAWVGSTLGSTTELLGPAEEEPVKVEIVEGG